MPDDRPDLYERDFFLWTQQQAEALRTRRIGANDLDYDRLAEEVRDLGSAEKNKVRSAVFRILEHLYKLHATGNREPVGHWSGEIANFRVDLEGASTPTIRRMVERELEDLHHKAARAAALRFRVDEPDAQIDPALRWCWDEITGAANDPLDRDYPRAQAD